MAEGRVAQIMPQRRRLREIFVKPQPPRDRAGDLGDLQRVGQTRAVMVPFRGEEYLRFVL